MKLYQSPTSPFVRMVRAAAIAKGLDGQIELVDARADQAAYEKINPLNKVPALVTDDGEVLIESRLICHYLDGLGGGAQLYPRDDAGLRHVLQQQAVIHGVIDAVVLRRMESRREDSERSQWWDDRQRRKIELGLARIESEAADYTRGEGIIPIMLGCVLAFMDRGGDDTDWRQGHPQLARWYEGFAKSPVMVATDVKR